MKLHAVGPQLQTRRAYSAPALPAQPQDIVTLSQPATPEAKRHAIKTLKTIQLLALSPAIKAVAGAALLCAGPAAVAHFASLPALHSVLTHLVHLGPWVIGFEAVRVGAQVAIPALAIRDINKTGEIRPWVKKTSCGFSKIEKAAHATARVAAYPFREAYRWATRQFTTNG